MSDPRITTPKLVKWNVEITSAVLIMVISSMVSGIWMILDMRQASAEMNITQNKDIAYLGLNVKEVYDIHQRDKLEYEQHIKDIRKDIKDSERANRQQQEIILSEIRKLRR
jgi:hypothetical protein